MAQFATQYAHSSTNVTITRKTWIFQVTIILNWKAAITLRKIASTWRHFHCNERLVSKKYLMVLNTVCIKYPNNRCQPTKYLSNGGLSTLWLMLPWLLGRHVIGNYCSLFVWWYMRTERLFADQLRHCTCILSPRLNPQINCIHLINASQI